MNASSNAGCLSRPSFAVTQRQELRWEAFSGNGLNLQQIIQMDQSRPKPPMDTALRKWDCGGQGWAKSLELLSYQWCLPTNWSLVTALLAIFCWFRFQDFLYCKEYLVASIYAQSKSICWLQVVLFPRRHSSIVTKQYFQDATENIIQPITNFSNTVFVKKEKNTLSKKKNRLFSPSNKSSKRNDKTALFKNSS